MDLLNGESELLEDWFENMINCYDEYREPILDETTVSIVKAICEALSQDIHVFIMSVEIIESYIKAKNKKQEVVQDRLLIISAVVLLSSKHVGEQIDVKISSINVVLNKLTGNPYTPRFINLAEMEVLSTLNDCLPITTTVDDLNIFVEMFVREYQLKANVRVLCLNILEMLYIVRKKWFFEIKNKYNINAEASEVFDKLVSSKFYLPIGVMLCALKLTKYKNFLKLDNLVSEMSMVSKIHTDHLNLICDKFIDIVETYCK